MTAIITGSVTTVKTSVTASLKANGQQSYTTDVRKLVTAGEGLLQELPPLQQQQYLANDGDLTFDLSSYSYWAGNTADVPRDRAQNLQQ